MIQAHEDTAAAPVCVRNMYLCVLVTIIHLKVPRAAWFRPDGRDTEDMTD